MEAADAAARRLPLERTASNLHAAEVDVLRLEFVPGLSALDSPAQILAWAVLFGYAQQLFTHLIDRHAQGLLENVSNQDTPRGAVPTPTVVTRAAESVGGNGATVIETTTVETRS